MTIRTLLVVASFTGLSFCAVANDDAPVQAVPYHYGMPLNVQKVLRLTEPPTLNCEVVTADMRYIDTAGRPAAITYRKLSEACSLQN